MKGGGCGGVGGGGSGEREGKKRGWYCCIATLMSYCGRVFHAVCMGCDLYTLRRYAPLWMLRRCRLLWSVFQALFICCRRLLVSHGSVHVIQQLHEFTSYSVCPVIYLSCA